MTCILGILCIIAISLLIALCYRKRLSEVYVIAAGVIVLILYIAGIFNTLRVGIFIVYIVSALCMAGSVYICLRYGIYKNKELNTWKKSMIFDVLLLAAGALMMYMITLNMKVGGGDEFTYWASSVKNMYATGKLGVHPDSWLYFPEYNPGMSLFEFFYVGMSEVFHENYLFFAIDVFILLVFFAIFSMIFKLYIENTIFVILSVFILLSFLPKTGRILQVDSVLILLVICLLTTYKYLEESSYKTVYMSMLFFVLILVKSSGIALGMYVMLYIILDMFVKHKKYHGQIAWYAVVLFATNYSWSAMIKKYNAVGTQLEANANINLNNIWNYICGKGEAWQYESTIRFFGKFLSHKAGAVFPFLIIVFMTIVFPVIFYFLTHNKKYLRVDLPVIIISLVTYGMYLLFMYIFMWGQITAEDVTSFWRYMGTILCIWEMYVLLETYIVTRESSIAVKRGFIVTLIIAALIDLPISNVEESFVPLWSSLPKTNEQTRSQYLDSEALGEKLDWKKDKVYIVSQYSVRTAAAYLDYWVTRYNIAPVKTNEFPSYSIGKTEHTKDYNNVEFTLEEFTRELDNGYTYVYLYAIDDYFEKDLIYCLSMNHWIEHYTKY